MSSQLELEEQLQLLRMEKEKLEEEVNRLQGKLKDHEQGHLVAQCGYLYRHRSHVFGLWGLLEKQWEMRFFSLVGNVLSFWKSDRDYQREPLGQFSVEGTVIVESKKGGQFFTFKIVDPKGNLIVRLSALNEAEGRHWVAELQRTGLVVISEEPDHPFMERTMNGSVRLQEQSDETHPGLEKGEKESQPKETILRQGSTGRVLTFTPSGVNENLRHRKPSIVTTTSESSGLTEDSTTSIKRQASAGKDSAALTPRKRKHDNGSGQPFTLRPSAPAHRKVKESPLSSQLIFQQSHAGLFNLSVMVLVAVNIRLIIENLMKYGILIRLGFYISSKNIRDWPLLLLGLGLSIFPTVALLIEKLKLATDISEPVVLALHSVNTLVGFFGPIYIMHVTNSSVVSAFVLIFLIVIIMMKMISYAAVNADIRALQKAGEEVDSIPGSQIEYPENLTVKNMMYFLAAPTLCYQLSYPRLPYIRKAWVARQVVKLLIFVGLQLFIIEQYINPLVKNSAHPLRGSPLHVFERVLKLSVPTLYVWLCFFYCFFHLWLNILAELLHFGDREFYKDWWNARTIEEYWRLWNMPVHKWLVRHVYFPSVRQGVSKPVAMLIVFFVSAVFHEVVIGVPCHMFRLWAFLGIMGQLPLVVLTNYMQRRFESTPMLGNMVFWFVFCIVGQPICVLLYYHDVVNQQQLKTA